MLASRSAPKYGDINNNSNMNIENGLKKSFAAAGINANTTANDMGMRSARAKIIELNNLNRYKLKRSLTYLLSHGYFKTVRALIQSRSGSGAAATVDLNETDQWWVLNPNINLINKKCVVVRRDRHRILSRLQTSIDFPTAAGRLASGNEPVGMPVGRTPLMLCSMIEDDSWAYSIAQVIHLFHSLFVFSFLFALVGYIF